MIKMIDEFCDNWRVVNEDNRRMLYDFARFADTYGQIPMFEIERCIDQLGLDYESIDDLCDVMNCLSIIITDEHDLPDTARDERETKYFGLLDQSLLAESAFSDRDPLSTQVYYDNLQEMLYYSLDVLTEREKGFITMRYGLDGKEFSLDEISLRFNISRARVRQIEQKTLRKLRGALWIRRNKGDWGLVASAQPTYIHVHSIVDSIEEVVPEVEKHLLSNHISNRKSLSDERTSFYDQLNDRSFLSYMGYSARLPRQERQAILQEAVSLFGIDKVANHLVFLTNLSELNYLMDNVRPRWQEDIVFVQHLMEDF